MRHLVVAWDPDEGTVVLDTRGLTPFDVVGILAGALQIARDEIPAFSFLEDEEEQEDPGLEEADDEEEE